MNLATQTKKLVFELELFLCLPIPATLPSHNSQRKFRVAGPQHAPEGCSGPSDSRGAQKLDDQRGGLFLLARFIVFFR